VLSVLQVSSVPEVDICIYRERETQRARARPTHTQREGVCGASSVLEVNICIYQERETHTRKEREMMREKEGMSARKRGSAHKRTGCPHKRNSWQTCAGQSSPSRQHGSSGAAARSTRLVASTHHFNPYKINTHTLRPIRPPTLLF